MKKTILRLAAFFLAIGILSLHSCQKSLSDENQSAEKNLHIVPDSVAVSIAEHFKPSDFFKESNATNNSPTRSSLTGNNKIKSKYLFNDAYGNPALYVFNFENNAGFIFVSGDYQMQPILAFVEHGEFRKDTVPTGLVAWVNKTMENIEVVRKGLYDNSKAALGAWRNYYKQNGNGSIVANFVPPVDNSCVEDEWTTVSVGPLLPVTWGQGCSYNNLCPNLSCNIGCGDGRAWTGCVATSTAQIVNFWHPNNSYGYNYASMPAASGNGEVQRLMRDLGTKVNMSYGCSGSGADASTVPNALKNNFGFTSANFVNYSWQRVRSNLSNHWPVLLDGCRTQTGHWFIINWWTSYSDCHEWVCDGFNEYTVRLCVNGQYSGGYTYLYFHMNWGWHEVGTSNDYNGWFAFDNWYIPGLNWNFQYAQDLTSEIHP